MCTVPLPPDVYPIAVDKYIKKNITVVLDGEHCLLAQQYSGISVNIKFPVSFFLII